MNGDLSKTQTRANSELNVSHSSASERFYHCLLDNRWRQSPWVCFSIGVHVFVVFLLSFITASICFDEPDDSAAMIYCSEIFSMPKFEELKTPVVATRCVLESKHDSPPTDPISSDPSDIVVPHEFLAQSELGDHWETINPDRPDTHIAFGNPESHFFYSAKGNDEPEGDGGISACSLDKLIGAGGNVSQGVGGGWGGGHGTGIGVSKGAGKGSFGSRNGGGRRLMVKHHGGSCKGEYGAKTRYQQPLGADGALCWLAQHQSPDGHWDCRQYKGKDNDVAVTGLALLAFLRGSHAENAGCYQENARRAVEWLKSRQSDNGMIADDFEKPGYAHAIAALSLTEAANASKNEETLKAAEKALRWSCSTEETSSAMSAWRYAGKTGDGDLSVTGWYLLQLSAARQAGLKVSESCFSNAEKFLKSVASKNKSGETIYHYRPGSYTNSRLNTIGNLCQQLIGANSISLNSDVQQMSALALTLPDRKNPDLYYWYYGSLCCYQQGGEAWQNWHAAMEMNLLHSQNRTGVLGGSWEPKGPFSEHWGRVGQTALGALCLEVYNRQTKLSENATIIAPEVKAQEIKEVKKEVTIQSRDHEGADTQTVIEEVSNAESYAQLIEQGFTLAQGDGALSTFAIDVDTASYSNARRILNEGKRPPKNAVRVEEMINYFSYNYAPPTDGKAFAVHSEIADCPWNSDHRLARVCLKSKEIPWDQHPSGNLVFLIDVSGSMSCLNKLPLVQTTLKLLVDRLNNHDKVAIVVYASKEGLALNSTTCDRKNEIKCAIDSLSAGGSTNGAGGIQEAYRVATENFIAGGINRVILCTDGDFNVGISDKKELFEMIQEKAKTGVFLSVMGFGMDNLKDNMLEGLADKGNGNYGYIDNEKEAKKLLVDQIGGTLITIAKDVKIQVEFNPKLVAFWRLIGYENRLMAAADFRNDKKDAGEIGAGHAVTALYEIVPCDSDAQAGAGAQPLKYQKDWEFTPLASSGESFTVFIRHKAPDADTATEISIPYKDQNLLLKNASEDYRWAAAVAMFGMQLRGSTHKGKCDWDLIEKTARGAMTRDPGGYRAEFLQLLNKARQLSPVTPTQENTGGEF